VSIIKDMSEIVQVGKQTSTKAELQRRIAYVMDLLAKNYKRSQIIEHVHNECEWNVTSNTIGVYINRAKGELVKEIRKSAVQHLAKSVMQLEDLYVKCYEEQDYRGALAVRKHMDDVLGVSADKLEKGLEDVEEDLDDELEALVRDVTPNRKKRAR